MATYAIIGQKLRITNLHTVSKSSGQAQKVKREVDPPKLTPQTLIFIQPQLAGR